jgi:hypothetical protein
MKPQAQHKDDLLASSIVDRGETWARWYPSRAREQHEWVQAVQQFQAMDTEAGREATRWLKEDSLLNHGSTVTRIMLLEGRVEGFYALASAQVKLFSRDHKTLLKGSLYREGLTMADAGAFRLKPTQPASLVAWIAKREGSEISGAEILWHAAKTALKIAEEQGNIALVLDPWDDITAERVWSKPPYNFKPSAPLKAFESGDSEQTTQPPRPRRLWRTLMSSDEGPV